MEEAIQVRDAQGGEVTVVTVGREDAEKNYVLHLQWEQIKQFL